MQLGDRAGMKPQVHMTLEPVTVTTTRGRGQSVSSTGQTGSMPCASCLLDLFCLSWQADAERINESMNHSGYTFHGIRECMIVILIKACEGRYDISQNCSFLI